MISNTWYVNSDGERALNADNANKHSSKQKRFTYTYANTKSQQNINFKIKNSLSATRAPM